MIQIEIPFPPSMNRLWRATKGGGVYRSPEYTKWKEGACWAIAAQCRSGRINGPFKLTMLVRAYDPCVSCSTHLLNVKFV